MRAVIQTVSECALTADGVPYSQIGAGMLILLGVKNGDGKTDAERLAAKISVLRIFCDETGKMNLSCTDDRVRGEIMIVSNFTLYGDCRKGRRPDFFASAPPERAKDLYDYFVLRMREAVGGAAVKTGVFGADMRITLTNDGPKTFLLDSEELK